MDVKLVIIFGQTQQIPGGIRGSELEKLNYSSTKSDKVYRKLLHLIQFKTD